jgi:hypothetical protein
MLTARFDAMITMLGGMIFAVAARSIRADIVRATSTGHTGGWDGSLLDRRARRH